MAEPGTVIETLLAIARDATNDGALPGQICQACVEGLDVDGAGISLLTGSTSWETICATDATMARVEELQYTLGEGPCIEAAASGRPVLVPDMQNAGGASRWPVFTAAMLEQTEVGALFALPLQLGAINLGVLDLYHTTPAPIDGARLRDAVCAVDVAATMLGCSAIWGGMSSRRKCKSGWAAAGAERHRAG